MAVCGGVGVLRRVSRKGGILFIVLLASRWVMILLLNSWCVGPPLKDIFPELYGIACDEDASVVKRISFSGDSYHWNVSFIQLVQDWELRVNYLLYGFDLFWSVERGWNR